MTIRNTLMTASITLCAYSALSSADQSLTLTPGASIEISHSTGKFDFLRFDSKRKRLLAAHENDGTADYFDLQKNTLITRLKVGGAVDTAVDTESKYYYVSVQETHRVAIVDAAGLKEVGSIKTPGPTDAILYDPKNKMIYVTHDNGSHVWVIDPAKKKVVSTIVIPGVPEYLVYDESTNRIYLNIKSKDVVAVIDPGLNKVVAEWPTSPATLPHGLALDAANHRVFSSGGNGKLVAIDTRTGEVTGTVAIAEKVDQIAMDTVAGLVYCAGTDKMSVVRVVGEKIVTLGEFTTAATARNVAVDPATHAVWTTYTDGKSSYARSWMAPQP